MRHPICSTVLILLIAGSVSADQLVLKDGRKIKGTYLGGTTRAVRIDVGGQVQQFSISEVQGVYFEIPDSESSKPAQNQQSAAARPNMPEPPQLPENPAARPVTGLPPLPGPVATVAGVEGGETFINQGTNAGLKVHQTLSVYRTISVTGVNGEPVTRRKFICTLTLTDVEEASASGPCAGDPPARMDIADAMIQ